MQQFRDGVKEIRAVCPYAEDTSPGLSQGEDHDISLITQPATAKLRGFVAFAAMKMGPLTAPLNASQGIKAGLNRLIIYTQCYHFPLNVLN